jgi:hypothetical protein
MRQHRVRLFALAALVLFPCWGCGSGGGGGALTNLVQVKGKVTYKGKPLTSGMIHFEPDGGFGRPATGKLQSDGSYALTTLKDGDGVVAGSHQVTVGGFDKPLASDRALKKYGVRRSSGLTAEVDSEHTEWNFDLK